MDTMTLKIEIPQGVNVDAQKLSKMATDFVHHYLFLVQREQLPKRAKKSFGSFRRLRGIISSDKSYKDMVEEAILDKYENILGYLYNYGLLVSVKDTAFTDLEDSYQYYAAIAASCVWLVTINISDFKNANQDKVKVVTPSDFVKLMNGL